MPHIFLQAMRTAARFEMILELENRAAFRFGPMFARLKKAYALKMKRQTIEEPNTC